MDKYKNFSAAIYCPVGNLIDIKDFDAFEKQFKWIEKHIKGTKFILKHTGTGFL